MKIRSKIIRFVEVQQFSCLPIQPDYYFCELVLDHPLEGVTEITVNFRAESIDEIEKLVNKFIIKIE